MLEYFKNIIIESTEAKEIKQLQVIQNLWSGYGEILRIATIGSEKYETVIVKHIKNLDYKKNTRNQESQLSHNRKVISYKIEIEWYKTWANKCDENCRIPHFIAHATNGNDVIIVLEDLNGSGFTMKRGSAQWEQTKTCLKWLANFHATYMMEKPEKLWEVGTYWHLDTRPDELKILKDRALQAAANIIDQKLNNCTFMTFVHGDAKLENFCFSKDYKNVAAVDFQYVGGGCGMKDVAYLVGSCLSEDKCEQMENEILDFYFKQLEEALRSKNKNIDFNAIETEWREMYPVAWTDFHRFLKGWSPGYWHENSYSERIAKKTISKLFQ